MTHVTQHTATVPIKIDEKKTREVTVYELSVKTLRELMRWDEKLSLVDLLDTYLPKFVDLTLDEMDDLYPSDLEKVYEKWKEINAPFLKAARAMDLWPLIKKRLMPTLNSLIKCVADSSNQGIQMFLNMVSPSSLPPTMNTQN